MNLHYWVSPETSPAQACVEFRLIIGLNYVFAIIINMFLSDVTESENLGQSLLTRLTRVGNIHSEMLWSRSTANKSHCIARRWRERERGGPSGMPSAIPICKDLMSQFKHVHADSCPTMFRHMSAILSAHHAPPLAARNIVAKFSTLGLSSKAQRDAVQH